jgi:hypothetical protein
MMMIVNGEYFRYLVIVMRILLKLMLIKQDGKVWIKFISLNVGTSWGFL